MEVAVATCATLAIRRESHLQEGITRCHQLLSQRMVRMLRRLRLDLLERRSEMESFHDGRHHSHLHDEDVTNQAG